MSKEELDKKMELYFLGRLDENEVSALKKYLDENSEIRDDVLFDELLDMAILEESEKDTSFIENRNALKKILSEKSDVQDKIKSRRSKLLYFLALFLFIIVAAVIYFVSVQKTSNDNKLDNILFAKNIPSEFRQPNSLTLGTSNDSNFELAKQATLEGHFNESFNLLSAEQDSSVLSETKFKLFYLEQSILAGEFQAGIRIAEEFINSDKGTKLDLALAKYYLTKAYIGVRDPDSASISLKDLKELEIDRFNHELESIENYLKK